MKAYYRNKLVDVIQWCNDWFSIELDWEEKVVTPSSLIFDKAGMIQIIEHKNNGTLLHEFEQKAKASPDPKFTFWFKRKLWN